MALSVPFSHFLGLKRWCVLGDVFNPKKPAFQIVTGSMSLSNVAENSARIEGQG